MYVHLEFVSAQVAAMSAGVQLFAMLRQLGCSVCILFFFFFNQKTAYEMRISDWSSDVCSSDLTFAFLQCGENVGLGRDLAEMRRSDLLLALADEHDVDGQLAPRGADRVERGEESRLGPLLVHRAAAHDRLDRTRVA